MKNTAFFGKNKAVFPVFSLKTKCTHFPLCKHIIAQSNTKFNSFTLIYNPLGFEAVPFFAVFLNKSALFEPVLIFR
ncbi:MAG: hypothetical protein IJF05_05085 [Clostridia bacterium]|nr:hypothetical protein [Clostridia bacterium]